MCGTGRPLTFGPAPQAEFTAMRDQYMRAGEGFIISYSITDRRSFQEARQFKQLIYRVRRTVDTPVVLVGQQVRPHAPPTGERWPRPPPYGHMIRLCFRHTH